MTRSDLSFNPEMLTLARESRGLTQSALAPLLNISQTKLSKIEAGAALPDEALLKEMSRALAYPEGFFARTDTIFGPGTSEFFHRRKKSLAAKKLDQVHAQINIRRMEVNRLLRAIELPEDRIPHCDPDDFENPAEVARAVRAAWNLPKGPIKNLTQSIEAAGGIVIPIDLGTPLIDAVTRYVPGMPHLFFVNSEAPGDRQRLSLAHELGHAVMHTVPSPTMEEEAFAFAAEFLMPAQEVSGQLGDVTLEKLAALKPYWRVAMAALLKRAGDLGKLTYNQERYLWAQMSKAGYRRREPSELDIPAEQPTVLPETLRLYLDHFGYSPAELSGLLSLHEEEVQEVYGVQWNKSSRGRLRVIGT